jgi:hypothetical protein
MTTFTEIEPEVQYEVRTDDVLVGVIVMETDGTWVYSPYVEDSLNATITAKVTELNA